MKLLPSSLLATISLVTACASTSPRAPSNTSASPASPRAMQPSSEALVAHLRTARVVAPRDLVCGGELTLGAFVSRVIDRMGVPPETVCEKGDAGWHCTAMFSGCAADPASDAPDDPRLWIEFDADDTGALIGTAINCGEEVGEG